MTLLRFRAFVSRAFPKSSLIAQQPPDMSDEGRLAVIDSATLLATVESANRRINAAINEATARCSAELAKTQQLTEQYYRVMRDSTEETCTHAVVAAEVAGQLASEVCRVNDELTGLRSVIDDANAATLKVAELERLLDALERDGV
jgi:phage FluMu gp28-like protein